MNPEQAMVMKFHEKFGFTISEYPKLISLELGKIRHEHTLEEMEELKTAMLNNDLVKIADGLTDALYFIYGTAVAYGIDLEPIFKEVHRANMTKERPPGVTDAKAVKGKNYSPPDIASIIADYISPCANCYWDPDRGGNCKKSNCVDFKEWEERRRN